MKVIQLTFTDSNYGNLYAAVAANNKKLKSETDDELMRRFIGVFLTTYEHSHGKSAASDLVDPIADLVTVAEVTP